MFDPRALHNTLTGDMEHFPKEVTPLKCVQDYGVSAILLTCSLVRVALSASYLDLASSPQMDPSIVASGSC